MNSWTKRSEETPCAEFYTVTFEFELGARGKSGAAAEARVEEIMGRIRNCPGLDVTAWEASLTEETIVRKPFRELHGEATAVSDARTSEVTTIYVSLEVTYRGRSRSYEAAVDLLRNDNAGLLPNNYTVKINREADGAEKSWGQTTSCSPGWHGDWR